MKKNNILNEIGMDLRTKRCKECHSPVTIRGKYYSQLTDDIRNPMNRLAELMIRKLSECELTGGFDAEKNILVVEGLNEITIRQIRKKRTKLPA